MRQIEVSTKAFAAIWALRKEGEETENEILERVLLDGARETTKVEEKSDMKSASYMDRGPRTWSKPTWATDLAQALEELGGRARLNDIYQTVSRLRRQANRSLPKSLQATVRRTLENHSSDSDNYTGGADLFTMPEGKGAGVWALR